MDLKNYMKNKKEKPLDNIVSDGGFCSVFRTIGCIGDSLASGEFESKDADGNNTYHDLYEYSWGQYMARIAGCKVYNFSRGGMTAKEYCESFARNNGFWGRDKACQGYIIALGVNDILNRGWEIGSVEDICLEDYTKNAKTFAGYYGEIIQRYKEISPDARFFFVTNPRTVGRNDDTLKKFRKILYEIADLFEHSYIIDLYEYGPVYDEEFKEQFYLHGHLNPCGYILTAKMFVSYIDYIVRHNIDDFRKIGFVNTGIETGI